MCMILIEQDSFLATGSDDAQIRLYDNKLSLSSDYKILGGHFTAIKKLAYSEIYRYLISCGFDYDILIWNVYLDYPVMKLGGHDAPLVTVIYPQSMQNYLISCDLKGVIRLWNL